MRQIATTIKNPELVTKRRRQIIAAAMSLFLEKGYPSTTMQEICEKSTVNRGSFYDYFQSKEDILVCIYKTMMYSEGNFDKAFHHFEITGWKDLEPYIRSVIHRSWNSNKRSIQVLYREYLSLDKKTARDVLHIESNYVKWVADNLRKGLGLEKVNRELEILANVMVYLNAFIPLRGWNIRHIDQSESLDFIVEVIMTRLRKIKKNARTARK
jgi:AcrR family transcriptional regulator